MMAEKVTKEKTPEQKIVLPLQPIKAVVKSPKNLIIFSKPKIGKTSALAELENAFLLDFEEGSDYVEAMKYKIDNVSTLFKVGKAIKEADYPYQYIIIDTVTALETMCTDYAEKLYAAKPMGKTWFKKDNNGKLHLESGKRQYGNILNLPNGAGYAYLREAVVKVTEYIKTLAPRTILSGHIKDVMLEKKGAEFTSSDLDLTGKIKRILTSQSDGIGYMYRGKGNQNILSFLTSDAVACGTRSPHLRNKEIVISEFIDDKFVTYWDKIYID